MKKKGVHVEKILQLKDNYCYLIIDKKSKKAIVVDPAESESVLNFVKKNNINLIHILITHHHQDHTAGIKGILKKIRIPVYSPSKKIEGTTKVIMNYNKIDLTFINFNIIKTPGHTLDHLIYYNEKK